MPPLARHSIPAVVYSPVDGQPASASSSQDHGKNQSLSRSCSIRRFGHRQAIRIIGQPYFAVQRFAQISIKWSSIHPSRVRVFDVVSNLRDCSWNSDSNGRSSPQFCFDLLHALLDRSDCSIVVVPGSCHTVPVQFPTVAFQRHKLNLRPTQIHTNSQAVLTGVVCLPRHNVPILYTNRNQSLFRATMSTSQRIAVSLVNTSTIPSGGISPVLMPAYGRANL